MWYLIKTLNLSPFAFFNNLILKLLIICEVLQATNRKFYGVMSLSAEIRMDNHMNKLHKAFIHVYSHHNHITFCSWPVVSMTLQQCILTFTFSQQFIQIKTLWCVRAGLCVSEREHIIMQSCSFVFRYCRYLVLHHSIVRHSWRHCDCSEIWNNCKWQRRQHCSTAANCSVM